MSRTYPQPDLPLQADQGGVRRLSNIVSDGRPRLVLVLDHREWLELLSDEWWPSSISEGGIRLGVGSSLSNSIREGRIAVAAIIDPHRLPNLNVPTYRTGIWANAPVRSLVSQDREAVWPGPIPLSAVESFMVPDERDRARLIAMIKGFANVEMPPQPIEVNAISCHSSAPEPPPHTELLRPPPSWNAIRGAAAMAAWAVPAIDPWLDSLCESLSIQEHTPSAAAKKVPWLQAPPWRAPTTETVSPPLWAATVEIFREVHIRSAWRPAEVLMAIVDRARQLGACAAAMESFANRTQAILEDRETIGRSGLTGDVMELALQLVLLRPTPDRFVGWIDDLPTMPPLAWWTGAILSGFLSGFRDLDLRFRGTAASRQLLSFRTWRLFSRSDQGARSWPDDSAAKLHWMLKGEKIQLMADKVVWAERTGSSRGRWYRANFDDQRVHDAALELARGSCPKGIRHILRVADERVPFSGSGAICIDAKTRELVATGQTLLLFNSDVKLEEQLDVEAFRSWMLEGCIAHRLPEPPKLPSNLRDAALRYDDDKRAGEPSVDAPPGLQIVRDFISAEEEEKLLAAIESGAWMQDLTRRVQHYGWRYDYKARKVGSDAYLGALPEWANELGRRLVDQGLIGELPDQLIVNEYVRDQGIAKHIDSRGSFRGEVATISLCESWGMIFRGPKRAKVEQVLERRSVAVFSGPARHTWTHEIPKRRNELAGPRHRRVSLTFRKVDIPATAA
jgi:alkylated DNA repair dioxygenase AlkB